ncbi:MAG: vWA domain-containing protein [Chloroflexota bacterium]|nr:vWA domain-containing protein [Chloroflexota bacterium]
MKLSRLSILVLVLAALMGLSAQVVGAQQTNQLDVVFVVDTTGSMGGFIAGVKSNITSIIAGIAATGADYQVGVIGFGDPDTQFFQALTADSAAITAGVNALYASGGGDTPELTYCGVSRAVEQMAYRGGRRIIILIGDANDKTGCDVAGIAGTSDDTIARANAKAVSVCAIPLTSDATPHFTTLASATGCGVYPATDPAGLVAAILNIVRTINLGAGVSAGCGINVPSGSVVGSAPAGARAFYAPDRMTDNTSITLNPGTYWVIGQDASETYYKIILSCQFLWVRKDTMGPNYDSVWNGAALPTRIVE